MVGKVKKAPRPEPKTDCVYVHQGPRCEWSPSLSPDCLKVETYLRMTEIPYENVDHETLTVSANSQLPYCVVNGKEISYSNHMLSEMAKMFNKEESAPPMDNGSQRAFEGMIEGRLHWVMIYMRATQTNQLPLSDVFQGRSSVWQFLRPLANKMASNKLKAKADHQGIGRQNAADVLATGKEDLRAISLYLGDKDYLAGDKPNKLDATAFAHLSQFWYIPTENELKTFIKEECPNLIDYMERMKTRFWSDWDEQLRKPTPPRRSKKEESSSEKVIENKETDEKTECVETTAAVVNGCHEKEEKEKEPEEKEKENKESIVEIAKIETPVAVDEKEKTPTLEKGVDESKHVSTPNGGGATAVDKIAE